MGIVQILSQHIGEIITAIGGLSLWGYERTKRKQEVQATETQHQQQIVDLYQEALSDLKVRYDEKFNDLKKDYNTKFNELEIEIKSLRTNLELWKNKYRRLKEEFNLYRENNK